MPSSRRKAVVLKGLHFPLVAEVAALNDRVWRANGGQPHLQQRALIKERSPLFAVQARLQAPDFETGGSDHSSRCRASPHGAPAAPVSRCIVTETRSRGSACRPLRHWPLLTKRPGSASGWCLARRQHFAARLHPMQPGRRSPQDRRAPQARQGAPSSPPLLVSAPESPP